MWDVILQGYAVDRRRTQSPHRRSKVNPRILQGGYPPGGSPEFALGLSIKGAARLHSHSLLKRKGNGT
jgi:hypothetical protein